MQILLANAKIMYDRAAIKKSVGELVESMSKPMFQPVADKLAAEMSQLDVDELARQLDCSRAIALENWKRYKNFHSAATMPAILAYNGQAYKHLKADTLSDEALQFGQKHLWITCFLYGLLRPMDAIVPYRMERPTPKPLPLVGRGEITSAIYELCEERKAQMTRVLIDSVKADDGVLIHLSTEEYEHLFDWKRVKEEVKVIQPLFYVRKPNGDLKMQAVWAKSCRGAMVRYILQDQITSTDDLKGFCHEGFVFNPNMGEEAFPHFVREQ